MDRNVSHIISGLLCILYAWFMPFLATASENNRFTVVIDAGHGGHDPGAIGKRGREKNINLNVALKLGRLIETNCPDTRVVYTRKTDIFVPLHRRAEIANNAKADLFISVHTNSIASRKGSVQGTETYTLGLHKTQENLEVAKKENSVILIEDDYKRQYAGFNPNSSESYIIFEFLQDKYMAQSVSLATMIQRQFRQRAKRVDKGVHQAGFLVLRETSMPSVLIELGYITNSSEESYLLSDSGSGALAQSIYAAFLNYKSQQQGKPLASAVETEQNIPAADTTIQELSTETPAKTEQSIPIEKESLLIDSENDNKDLTDSGNEKPVFKIQILTSGQVLRKSSRLLKGLSPVSYYKEKGIYKYTYCESTDYNYVLRQKRKVVDAKFKDAFIIAFKNGEKMNINQAIREFKNNRR